MVWICLIICFNPRTRKTKVKRKRVIVNFKEECAIVKVELMEAILTNKLGQNLTSDPIPFTLKGPYLSENAQQ